MKPGSPTSPAAWQKNYRLGVINGILFILAETLMDPTLVLVAFLSHLTHSPLLLGLVVPLRDGTWYLPQVWVSGFLQSQPRKIVIYRRLSVLRMACWLSVALAVNFVRQPVVLIAAFLTAFTVSSLASGLSGLPFLEVVSKTIPADRRGVFFATRFGIGGLFAIFGSLLVRYLLDPAGPLPFPYNFGMLAALYFLLASTSLISFNQVDEPPDETVKPRAPLKRQLSRALAFLRTDHSYRRLLTLQSMMMLAGSATPFFAIYVQQSLGGSSEMVGIYLGIIMVTSLAFNPVFGRVSRRRGNRQVMALSALAGASMSLAVIALVVLAKPLGISGQAASLWLVPVFVLSSIRTTGMGVGGNSLLLDFAPPAERSLYIGFYNSMLGIVLLSTSLSGVIVQGLGFPFLVALTLIANLSALTAALRLAPPRED